MNIPLDEFGVRHEDVSTFLELVGRVRDGKFGTLKAAISANPTVKYTTVLAQLHRLLRFAAPDARSQSDALELLFRFDPVLDRLLPTTAATVLERKLEPLPQFYLTLREQVQETLRREGPPALRVGASQTIGLRILPAVLSCLTANQGAKLPDGTPVRLVIDASDRLIARLHTGELDLLINWGPEVGLLKQNARHRDVYRERDYDVRFVSFGYRSRMVLIAGKQLARELDEDRHSSPPAAPPPARRGERSYDALRQVWLREVPFSDQMRLIHVPSWNRPRELSESADRLTARGLAQQCPHYEEALALARMAQGVAVVSEVFLHRGRVTAYQLLPHDWFTRPIGVYLNTRRPVLAEGEQVRTAAAQVISLIDAYLARFGECGVRQGKPPFYREDYNGLDYDDPFVRDQLTLERIAQVIDEFSEPT